MIVALTWICWSTVTNHCLCRYRMITSGVITLNETNNYGGFTFSFKSRNFGFQTPLIGSYFWTQDWSWIEPSLKFGFVKLERGIFLNVEIWWKSDATFAVLNFVIHVTQTLTVTCNLIGSLILLSTSMIAWVWGFFGFGQYCKPTLTLAPLRPKGPWWRQWTGRIDH